MDSQLLQEQLELIERNATTIELTIQQMKERIHQLVEENSNLKIENLHLRDRLEQLDKEDNASKTSKVGLSNLSKLYDSGIHICHSSYGAKRNEMCLLCLSLLNQLDT